MARSNSSILDRLFFQVSIERALFNAYIMIFLATAVVTLVGILKVADIDRAILDLLVKSLIVEVIGGVAALFGSRLLKGSFSIKMRLAIREVPENFDLTDLSRIKVTCTFIDPTGGESTFPVPVYEDDVGLCVNVSPSDMKQRLSVVAEIDGSIYEGSDWLETRTVNLKKKLRGAVGSFPEAPPEAPNKP